MFRLLQAWPGAIEINGKHYNSVNDVSGVDFSALSKDTSIKLLRVVKELPVETPESIQKHCEIADSTYTIKVKKYMTEKSTPTFDFMQRWNNDVPMPLMTMTGKKIKETKGMVYMELHGDITSKITSCCMKCGKPITNEVSQYFGMGPICGGHNYVNPFATQEELDLAVEQYKAKLRAITWQGWVVKSAIIEIIDCGTTD